MKLSKRHLSEIVEGAISVFKERSFPDLNQSQLLAYCYLQSFVAFTVKYNVKPEDIDFENTDFNRKTPEPLD